MVLFDAKGQRLRAAPLEVKEGGVTCVAFGPGGALAAGYWRRGGGVVLFDAKGQRLRAVPLEVKEGDVTSMAFGPGGTLAAGYEREGGGSGGGGVVLLGADGQRLRAAQLQVQEGGVSSVAFGPGGTLAAAYDSGLEGLLGGGSGGGVVLLGADGQRLRAAPLEAKEGGVSSVAFGPGGTLAAGYGRHGIIGGDDGGVVLLGRGRAAAAGRAA